MLNNFFRFVLVIIVQYHDTQKVKLVQNINLTTFSQCISVCDLLILLRTHSIINETYQILLMKEMKLLVRWFLRHPIPTQNTNNFRQVKHILHVFMKNKWNTLQKTSLISSCTRSSTSTANKNPGLWCYRWQYACAQCLIFSKAIQ